MRVKIQWLGTRGKLWECAPKRNAAGLEQGAVFTRLATVRDLGCCRYLEYVTKQAQVVPFIRSEPKVGIPLPLKFWDLSTLICKVNKLRNGLVAHE